MMGTMDTAEAGSGGRLQQLHQPVQVGAVGSPPTPTTTTPTLVPHPLQQPVYGVREQPPHSRHLLAGYNHPKNQFK